MPRVRTSFQVEGDQFTVCLLSGWRDIYDAIAHNNHSELRRAKASHLDTFPDNWREFAAESMHYCLEKVDLAEARRRRDRIDSTLVALHKTHHERRLRLEKIVEELAAS
ncbi:hypothetical protein EUZ85_19430 [Hahella sp. KA22]|uniref:hypothetical protein n=1 Tax=Hahella sp. KA22 TaxID=1628392 RepID=UPI000FDF0405|nr:hypothetical protein [Hahella sp. KA22]AZZ92776.1 hypothetical protein ENC22_16850 [Hahella sp. KA22]QAY56150.1 hypothetical protein EUZ85_19430 [Hahella sp. KA22]